MILVSSTSKFFQKKNKLWLTVFSFVTKTTAFHLTTYSFVKIIVVTYMVVRKFRIFWKKCIRQKWELIKLLFNKGGENNASW